MTFMNTLLLKLVKETHGMRSTTMLSMKHGNNPQDWGLSTSQ